MKPPMNTETGHTEMLRALQHEAAECVTKNILPFWLTRMRDRDRGGWYGRMTGSGVTERDAVRGAILYGRLLWTFSAAHRVLGKRGMINHSEYIDAATMTKDYILRYFIDTQYGGTYWSIDADGVPCDTKKQFYALGFMLYGFSEYARASGDAEALEVALQLYDTIEEHARDSEHGGYIEACTRDWMGIDDMRLSAKDENCPKSQNTHLHILEAYTNLHKLLRDTGHPRQHEQGKKLAELIDIFTHHILNPKTHHLDLFFDNDWRRMSTTESYGHDIECSWLLHEAALALDDIYILNKVEPIVKEIARASEKGLQADGSMIYEGEPDNSRFDLERHWWVQTETVVGFFNLYQHFGDETALTKAMHCWQYIKNHLIDHEHGEWYWSIHADGSINLDDDRAGFWKCPYHNSRMCLKLIAPNCL